MQRMIGTVEEILPGGEALVRVDGEVVLVRNGVPGDRLDLRETGRRRGVRRAAIIAILEASSQRIHAPCPIATRCGGCALQYIAQEDQAALKSAWVRNAFGALIDVDTIWTPAGGGAHQRRRLRWFVGDDEAGAYLGFREPASHRVVRQTACMVAAEELNRLRVWLEAGIDLTAIDAVQCVALSDGIHVVLEAGSKPQITDVDTLALPLPLQWWWRDREGVTRPQHRPVQRFHDQLPAGDVALLLQVGPDDFVQGEAAGNRQLVSQIQTWAGRVNRIVDLFCGIGNLSLPLAAASGASLFGAELNAASVRAANQNAEQLNVNGRFVQANLFERGCFEGAGGGRGHSHSFSMEDFIGADLLLLDPPRRGAREICRQMGRLLPRKVIMISCDPASGARDGLILNEQGYRLKALRALDLFPGAGHVETMSLWLPE